MSKLPQLSANEFIKILSKFGFVIVRQRGSHISIRHEDGRSTTVPNHPGEKLDRGLMNKILKKDVQIPRDEFLEML